MATVTELDLPHFDYFAPDLRAGRFHEVMLGLRDQGWLARNELGVFVLDREAGEFFLRSRATTFPGLELAELFGVTQAEQLACGMHVHVSTSSEEEAVGALDRVRPWLPVLTALSVNSPFWQGVDTGYAGFRSQLWRRWPHRRREATWPCRCNVPLLIGGTRGTVDEWIGRPALGQSPIAARDGHGDS